MREFLKEFEYKFDKIIIESSPFLRCWLTAGHIVNEINEGREGAKLEVKINYRSSEMLTKNDFENPLCNIELSDWVDYKMDW